jgi:hypothetical protein
MRGVACEDRTHAVLAKAGERYHVETSAILSAPEDPERAHDALVQVLTAAIADVEASEDR